MTDSIPAGPAPEAPGPPPPPPRPTPPLERSRTDRYLGGVCGGLGAHFGVAPLLFRLGFVALTFAGGVGLLLYLVAWAVLPESGSGQRAGWSRGAIGDHSVTQVIVYLLLAFGALVLAASSLHVPHGGFVVGAALVGLGVLLLVFERERSTPAGYTAPMTTAPAPYAAGTFATAGATPATPTWGAARTPRPRSMLGLLTVAGALLAVGVAALLDAVGVASLSIASCLAIALVVVGAGLVAGTWFGRSRMLIVIGALLVPLTLSATLVDEPLTGGTGNVIVAPQGLADLKGEYHLAAGQLTVDLSQVPLTASPTVKVTVALGRLTVLVPPQANVYVAAHAGAGHVDLFGTTDDGVNIDSPVTQSPSPGGGTIHLSLSVGFGEIDVVDSAAAPVPGT